ncbi:S8 family serine peptidase [Candidatus Woesearchaeota archaeon]|nr:S8 family serine peptidase [Candidatus Woesearchaeota archaeon]
MGHGTFVASIVGSNNSLINGVAPQSKLIILKNGNSTPDEDATQMSVEWCYNNRTKFNTSVITISSSLGAASTTDNCFSTNDLSIAIRSAYDVGIAITIASGNDGSKTQISYPACVNGSISVGASNDDDKMSAFSNRNANLDVVAPGENICAARASSASFGSPICIDSQHAISQGTSFATPHVAGAVALLQDAYNGTLKPGQIQEALNASGKSIHDSFLFFLNRRTFYRVDVKAALEYLPVLNVRHLDWPTDHHDYRRTGFTLLKGDVNKAADIDASNVALKDSVTSDIVIRPSVSDLDNNEHQDVVTVLRGATGF